MLHYTITPLSYYHQWHIRLTFKLSDNCAQPVKLANWTPGSYMIRDFSRHIISIQAQCNGNPVQLVQTAKNEWQLPPQSGEYQLDYIVYGNDLSVRSSYLDGERGFFDGACLFLYLPQYRNEIHSLNFENLPENWQIATTLPQITPNLFQAASYDELIDHPVELGAHIELLDFNAAGIPHRIAISGYYNNFDRDRLIKDSQKICTAILKNFPEPAPFQSYLFLLHVGDNLYGGLEHTSSTALLADRHALPQAGMREADSAYIQLLGLISHEYFHAWNVKSIKPAAFIPYNLDQEVYTEQLWAFEGITSYYDDLMLVRSGVISSEAYLSLLAQTMTRVRQTPGRQIQTLTESSFNAWHKYYKQDENSPNATTSYYQQGSLAALCLDLTIRSRRTGYSLDNVMQHLYRDWTRNRQGIPERYWQEYAQEATGLDLSAFFQAALYSTAELPLEACLKNAGIELRWLPDTRNAEGRVVSEFPDITPKPDLGCRFKQQDGAVTITHVFNGGSAEAAGLMPKDKIIAIDGFVCTDFTAQTATAVGDKHLLYFFRHGMLRQTEYTVQAAAAHTAFLKVTDPAALQRWLYNLPADTKKNSLHFIIGNSGSIRFLNTSQNNLKETP